MNHPETIQAFDHNKDFTKVVERIWTLCPEDRESVAPLYEAPPAEYQRISDFRYVEEIVTDKAQMVDYCKKKLDYKLKAAVEAIEMAQEDLDKFIEENK